jgi:hypothetical protein
VSDGHVADVSVDQEAAPIAVERCHVDVDDEVVADHHSLHRDDDVGIRRRRQIEPGTGVADQVVSKVRSVVPHHVQRPLWFVDLRAMAPSVLRMNPVVLEDVALDERAPRGLRLVEILHHPLAFPLQRLEEVIAPDLDVARYVVGERRICRLPKSRSRQTLRDSLFTIL